ncbi:sensor histidine kinase [Glaciecola siphonariae]|uniref:Sensor histidine kinase n=1 Tax=Glaciecola siphonariae TaxID=521012 RepID=A0ABV9LUX7_9ALTE
MQASILTDIPDDFPPELVDKKNPLNNIDNQFWVLQAGGWIGYTGLVFLAIIHPQLAQADFSLSKQLSNLLIEVLSGFTLTTIQWVMIKRIVHLPLRLTLFVSFFTAAILGIMLNVIKLASYKHIVFGQVWYQEFNLLEFGGWLLFSVATMYVFTAIFFIMLYNGRLRAEHEMLLRAQTSAKEAQLQMLRYQLNPHFMFNTLNAISTLIYKNENDKANEMLDRLCSFFRFSLSQKNEKENVLSDELDICSLYLSIEKVRFGERLIVEYDVDAVAANSLVPSFLLQPLIENAIKYGIESRKEAGSIIIKARKVKEQLHLSVYNQGGEKQTKNTEGLGIGLSNTRARLKNLYNKQCDLLISTLEDNATRVDIHMPYMRRK